MSKIPLAGPCLGLLVALLMASASAQPAGPARGVAERAVDGSLHGGRAGVVDLGQHVLGMPRSY